MMNRRPNFGFPRTLASIALPDQQMAPLLPPEQQGGFGLPPEQQNPFFAPPETQGSGWGLPPETQGPFGMAPDWQGGVTSMLDWNGPSVPPMQAPSFQGPGATAPAFDPFAVQSVTSAAPMGFRGNRPTLTRLARGGR